MTILALSQDQIDMLRQVVSDHEQDGPPCRYRGCPSRGLFFLNRQVRSGIQKGLYCDSHEKEFGEQNLRREAKEDNATVGTLVDSEGDFRGITT